MQVLRKRGLKVLKKMHNYLSPWSHKPNLDITLSFQAIQLQLKESPAQLMLISRRCTRRLGTFLQIFPILEQISGWHKSIN